MTADIISRDDQGRILPGGKNLTSEEARELNRKSREKRQQNSEEAVRAGADAILRDLAGVGYDEAQADHKKLAEIAAKGGPGAVAALNQLQRQTGNIPKAEKSDASVYSSWNPESGDPCPLCGGPRVTIALDDESAIYLIGVLNAPNVEDGSPGPVAGRKNGGGRRP